MPAIFTFSRFSKSSMVFERLRTDLSAIVLSWLDKDLFCDIFSISCLACSYSDIKSCILLKSKHEELIFEDAISSLSCFIQRDSLVYLEAASSSNFRFLLLSLLGESRLSIKFLRAMLGPVIRPCSSLLDYS